MVNIKAPKLSVPVAKGAPSTFKGGVNAKIKDTTKRIIENTKNNIKNYETEYINCLPNSALTQNQVNQMIELARSQEGVQYNSLTYGPAEEGGGGFGCAMFVAYI